MPVSTQNMQQDPVPLREVRSVRKTHRMYDQTVLSIVELPGERMLRRLKLNRRLIASVCRDGVVTSRGKGGDRKWNAERTSPNTPEKVLDEWSTKRVLAGSRHVPTP